jgi:hypothetical protein
MAADAAVVLHQIEPIGQMGFRWNIALAAELVGARNFQHRVPVDRRIDLRRRGVVRRRHRGQVQLLAGIAIDLRRVDEAVAAHPDFIMGGRQVGYDIAALVVGNDHLGVTSLQIVGLGDHPDAGFRTMRPRDHTADGLAVDRHRVLRLRLHGYQRTGEVNRRRARE